MAVKKMTICPVNKRVFAAVYELFVPLAEALQQIAACMEV